MKKAHWIGIPALLLAGCNGLPFGAEIQGEGKVTSKSHSVSGYEEIQVRVPADVEIKVGGSNKFEISAQENLHENFEIEVDGTRLVIASKDSYSTTQPVKITITTPKLTAIRVMGSGDATVSGIEAKDFTAEISGSGDITLKGKSDFARFDIKGSGDINGEGLKAKDGRAYIAGSGDISIAVSGELEAEIKGSGDITYIGDPKVKTNIMGSGNIGQK